MNCTNLKHVAKLRQHVYGLKIGSKKSGIGKSGRTYHIARNFCKDLNRAVLVYNLEQNCQFPCCQLAVQLYFMHMHNSRNCVAILVLVEKKRTSIVDCSGFLASQERYTQGTWSEICLGPYTACVATTAYWSLESRLSLLLVVLALLSSIIGSNATCHFIHICIAQLQLIC